MTLIWIKAIKKELCPQNPQKRQLHLKKISILDVPEGWWMYCWFQNVHRGLLFGIVEVAANNLMTAYTLLQKMKTG